MICTADRCAQRREQRKLEKQLKRRESVIASIARTARFEPRRDRRVVAGSFENGR
jgi:hypothetical protein